MTPAPALPALTAQPVLPVSVVAWGATFCDCPTPAPPVDPAKSMDVMVESSWAQLSAGPTYAHPCDTSEDWRPWLVRSDAGLDVWFCAPEFAFDAFLDVPEASVMVLHEALLDLERWFDLPAHDDGRAATEDPGHLITQWAPLGLGPAQAVAADRADLDPCEFGDWLDLAAEQHWSMDQTVECATSLRDADEAQRWSEAGFAHFLAEAAYWASHVEMSPRAAWYLYAQGHGAVETGQIEDKVRAHLVTAAPTGPDGHKEFAFPFGQVLEDATVLRASVPRLSIKRAVACAKAGIWDPDEARALLRRKDLDWDVLGVMGALHRA